MTKSLKSKDIISNQVPGSATAGKETVPQTQTATHGGGLAGARSEVAVGGFLSKPCPQCYEDTLVRVLDKIKPIGVSLEDSGFFNIEGTVLRSHVECRSCGYDERQTMEVQDERPATDDDPA